jgi:hypothetical protein
VWGAAAEASLRAKERGVLVHDENCGCAQRLLFWLVGTYLLATRYRGGALQSSRSRPRAAGHGKNQMTMTHTLSPSEPAVRTRVPAGP